MKNAYLLFYENYILVILNFSSIFYEKKVALIVRNSKSLLKSFDTEH